LQTYRFDVHREEFERVLAGGEDLGSRHTISR